MPCVMSLTLAALLGFAAYVSAQDGFNMVPSSDAGLKIKEPGYSFQNVHVKWDASGRLASVYPYAQIARTFRVGSKGQASPIHTGLEFSTYVRLVGKASPQRPSTLDLGKSKIRPPTSHL